MKTDKLTKMINVAAKATKWVEQIGRGIWRVTNCNSKECEGALVLSELTKLDESQHVQLPAEAYRYVIVIRELRDAAKLVELPANNWGELGTAYAKFARTFADAIEKELRASLDTEAAECIGYLMGMEDVISGSTPF